MTQYSDGRFWQREKQNRDKDAQIVSQLKQFNS